MCISGALESAAPIPTLSQAEDFAMDSTPPLIDWINPRPGRLDYDAVQFALAKAWFFEQWAALAAERGQPPPEDLSGSCKYGSLFMQSVFGGALRGHYEHQYNFIAGRLVDLSHDALDVGRMFQPYLHEPEYFSVPELQSSLAACLPRAQRWAEAFIAERQEAGRKADLHPPGV